MNFWCWIKLLFSFLLQKPLMGIHSDLHHLSWRIFSGWVARCRKKLPWSCQGGERDENCSWHQLEVPTLAATDGNHGGKTLIENCINKKHPWDIHEPFAAAVSNPAIASKNLWILNLQGPCPSRESTEVWQPHRSKREWHDVTRNGGS